MPAALNATEGAGQLRTFDQMGGNCTRGHAYNRRRGLSCPSKDDQPNTAPLRRGAAGLQCGERAVSGFRTTSTLSHYTRDIRRKVFLVALCCLCCGSFLRPNPSRTFGLGRAVVSGIRPTVAVAARLVGRAEW